MGCACHGSAADCYCDRIPEPPSPGWVGCLLAVLGALMLAVVFVCRCL
jgi:hypothetical protein